MEIGIDYNGLTKSLNLLGGTMDRLQSIKNCINDQLDNTDFNDLIERRNTKLWLEGWVCGATDVPLHNEDVKLRDEAMNYLQKQYINKRKLGK